MDDEFEDLLYAFDFSVGYFNGSGPITLMVDWLTSAPLTTGLSFKRKTQADPEKQLVRK
jgi:hypothetical protein